MSTAAPPEAEAPTRLRLEEIQVLDSNPRGAVDEESEAFDELVASIQRNGIVQPVLVGQPVEVAGTQSGKAWPLIAGHRRLSAARIVGLEDIPVLQADYGGDDVRARVAAIAENVVRLDLSPLQEARALADLQATGLNQEEAAEALGKSVRWARERERLLRLPKRTASAFDAGAIAGSASVAFEKIASQAPKMAELLAGRAEETAEEEGPQYGGKTDVASEVRWLTDRHVKGRIPTEKDGKSAVGCFVDADAAITYEDCVRAGMPHDKLREFKSAIAKVTAAIEEPGMYMSGPSVLLEEADVDAARAFGCLLELDGIDRWGHPSVDRYITDGTWLADRIPAAIERAEAERKQKIATHSNRRRGTGSSAASGGERAAPPSAEQRQARKEAKEAEAKQLEETRAANLELGQRASRAYEAPEPTLEEAKALVALALGPHITAIGGAIAYTDKELQKEDPKNPGFNLHAPGYEVAERIWEALEACKSPEQCFGLFLRVATTALYADGSVERLESKRAAWSPPAAHDVEPRLRKSAAERKIIPESMVKIAKQREREEAAAEKRKQNARLGSVLEALAASKKGATPGKVSARSYNRAQKDVFTAGVGVSAVQEMLDAAAKRKEVDRKGDAGDPKATYLINDRGRKKLEKLAEEVGNG